MPEPIADFDEQKKATTLIKEIIDKHSKSLSTYEELRQAVNLFNGNFNETNIFSFKTKLITKDDFLSFAFELKEFIEEDKIKEYEKRINDRFAHNSVQNVLKNKRRKLIISKLSLSYTTPTQSSL